MPDQIAKFRSGSPPWNSILTFGDGLRKASASARSACSRLMSNCALVVGLPRDLAILARVVAPQRDDEDVEARELGDALSAGPHLEREEIERDIATLRRRGSACLRAHGRTRSRARAADATNSTSSCAGHHDVLADVVRHDVVVALEATEAQRKQPIRGGRRECVPRAKGEREHQSRRIRSVREKAWARMSERIAGLLGDLLAQFLIEEVLKERRATSNAVLSDVAGRNVSETGSAPSVAQPMSAVSGRRMNRKSSGPR